MATFIASVAAMAVLWGVLNPAAGAPKDVVDLTPLFPMMLALVLVLVILLGDPGVATTAVALTWAVLAAIPYYPGHGLWTLSFVGAAFMALPLYLSARLGALARRYLRRRPDAQGR